MGVYSVQNVTELFRFHTKDEIRAARIEATKAYRQNAEVPKTSNADSALIWNRY